MTPSRTKLLPKILSTPAIAATPLCVSSWAMASVSTIASPSLANSSATVLLPLPMPPVRPMTSFFATSRAFSSSHAVQVPAHHRFAPVQGDHAGDGDVGTEVEAEATLVAAARGEHLRGAERQPHQRRGQDHQRQHLPAQERADRGEHLEIAEAHAFLAGEEL